jgi:uncharacterized protein (DUF952 family)
LGRRCGVGVLTRLYKILPRGDWARAQASGAFEGSADDIRDGFVHLSTAAQAAETARRHFTGQGDLVVLAVEADQLGPALAWEPSRGGDLFPHLHGGLACTAVIAVTEAPLDHEGVPQVGDLAP